MSKLREVEKLYRDNFIICNSRVNQYKSLEKELIVIRRLHSGIFYSQFQVHIYQAKGTEKRYYP